MPTPRINKDADVIDVGEFSNSYLAEWRAYNYRKTTREGEPVLVKPGVVDVIEEKEITLVSFGEPSIVTFRGEERVGVARLISEFGAKAVRDAKSIKITHAGRVIYVSTREEARRRAEIPSKLRRIHKLLPGMKVTVQLAGEDVIPIINLEYPEVYVHYDYVKEGITLRRVNAVGKKTLTIGMLAPIDIRGTSDEDDFWDNLYDGLTKDILDEFTDEIDLLGREENFNEREIYNYHRGFAKDGSELKRDAKQEGSP